MSNNEEQSAVAEFVQKLTAELSNFAFELLRVYK
jgi:hypothetical protein